jgi:hypothetical protein
LVFTAKFEGGVRGAHPEVGNRNAYEVVHVGEKIVSAIEKFNDGVEDEVGEAVRNHEHVV